MAGLEPDSMKSRQAPLRPKLAPPQWRRHSDDHVAAVSRWVRRCSRCSRVRGRRRDDAGFSKDRASADRFGPMRARPSSSKLTRPRVEGCVPQSGEQQAVVNLQALGIARASRPGYDVRGSQQRWVVDAGDGATPVPILDESPAEDALADALYREPLGFRRLRQATRFSLEFCERRVREAQAESIGAVEGSV